MNKTAAKKSKKRQKKSIKLNTIYHESCLETLKRMDDDSIDLVITSPPYNMNLRIRNGEYCSRQIVKHEFATKYDGFDDNLPIDEFYELHSKVLSELLRVSKLIFYNIQIVTGSKRAFFKIIGKNVVSTLHSFTRAKSMILLAGCERSPHRFPRRMPQLHTSLQIWLRY